MKLCPMCGSATYFNSSLFTNKCVNCNWKDEHELKENILIKRKGKSHLNLPKGFDLREDGVIIDIEISFLLN